MLSERSQIEKDKHHMTLLICGIKRTNTNKQNRNRLINTENSLLVARGERVLRAK